MNTAKFPRPPAANGEPGPQSSGLRALAGRPSEPAFEPAKPLTKTLFYASPAPPPPSAPSAPVNPPGAESTHYFSVEELLGRRSPASIAEPAPALPEVPSAGKVAKEPSGLAAFRAASPARKAILAVLPLLIGLVLARPALRDRFAASAHSVPSATIYEAPAAALQPSADPQPSPPLAPPVPKMSLPNGVSLARAAADSVAAGDYARALALYRGLAAREPHNPAHARAVSILEQRARQAGP
jgi:hypothetical protein